MNSQNREVLRCVGEKSGSREDWKGRWAEFWRATDESGRVREWWGGDNRARKEGRGNRPITGGLRQVPPGRRRRGMRSSR